MYPARLAEIMDFQEFQKNHAGNPWFGAHFGYPGSMSFGSREEWEELAKSENLMLEAAVGAAEARNLLGMLVVMSL